MVRASARPTGTAESRMMPKLSEWHSRFESLIDKSQDCHIWTGCKDKKGYGHFSFEGTYALAHRLSFLIAGGAPGAPVVMHACNNPSCVNPAHLDAGTHQENYDYMVACGRRVVSEGAHLRDRERHPRRRPVMTPRGRFESASLAASAFGISRGYASVKAKTGTDGWSYL